MNQDLVKLLSDHEEISGKLLAQTENFYHILQDNRDSESELDFDFVQMAENRQVCIELLGRIQSRIYELIDLHKEQLGDDMIMKLKYWEERFQVQLKEIHTFEGKLLEVLTNKKDKIESELYSTRKSTKILEKYNLKNVK